MAIKNPFKGMSVGVMGVNFTTFLVAISTAAFFSITPFYLRDVLGATFGAIALIEGATEVFSQLARLVSGIIADYMRKNKPMFLLGTILSAIARPLFIFANGIGMVTFSKIFDRLGNGFSATPRDAYVAQQAPSDRRGESLGITMTFKTIGCVLGPFSVMYVMKYFTNISLKTLIIMSSVPSFLAVFVCMFMMKEKIKSKEIVFPIEISTVEKQKEKEKNEDNSFKLTKIAKLPNIYWIFLFIMTLFMIARPPESFILLSLRERGVPMWFCSGTIGFFNAVSVFISYPAGALSDKFGRSSILIFSFLTLALALFCFSTHSITLGIIGVLFWGVQRSSSQILSVACISDIVPKNILGSAIGLLNCLTGFSTVVAGIVTGRIANNYSIYLAYTLATALSAIALIAMLIFSRYMKNIKNKNNLGNDFSKNQRKVV